MNLGSGWVIEWMFRAADSIDQHRVLLGDLDREIGDGDHGENMDRGFSAVREALEGDAANQMPSSLFRQTGMILLSSIGGAAGPLYGTAFLRAAEATEAYDTLDAPLMVRVLAAARDGIVTRGHAALGDKTMVDAWDPAVDAARAALERGADTRELLHAAADAARAGAAATEPLVAHRGRASYLGDRSIGHRDPGAESSALILAAAAAAADDLRGGDDRDHD